MFAVLDLLRFVFVFLFVFVVVFLLVFISHSSLLPPDDCYVVEICFHCCSRWLVMSTS